jgi:hypothetical protein
VLTPLRVGLAVATRRGLSWLTGPLAIAGLRKGQVEEQFVSGERVLGGLGW